MLACVDKLWYVAQAMQQVGQSLQDLQVDMQEIGEPVYAAEAASLLSLHAHGVCLDAAATQQPVVAVFRLQESGAVG